MVSFWDTSALAPLLVREADSDIREAELLGGGVIVVWWGTRVELRSALERRRRDVHKSSRVFNETGDNSFRF